MSLPPAQLRALVAAFPTRGASRHDITSSLRLRAQLLEAIAPYAAGLDFDPDGAEPLEADALADLPPHIFLVWCEESEQMAYFYAIPEADLSEVLAQSLHMIAGAHFTDAAGLSPEQWGAALRLMAAIGTPFARDAEDFFANLVKDSAPHEALPDLPEIEQLFDLFARCFVEGGAGLNRRFSRVITITRTA